MSVTQNGMTGLPTTAPVITKEFIPFVGETQVHEWPLGEPTAVAAQYNTLKATIGYGTTIAGITTRTAEGRSLLTVRYNTDSTGTEIGGTSDITVVEELVAVDLVRDISAAPYFAHGRFIPHRLWR